MHLFSAMFEGQKQEGAMQQEQIRIASAVRLKSGGPIMTVSSIHDDEARCEWFDSSWEPQACSYPLSMLTPVKPRYDA
jgi:uncharacterized protein YodC (DUF2158 family)